MRKSIILTIRCGITHDQGSKKNWTVIRSFYSIWDHIVIPKTIKNIHISQLERYCDKSKKNIIDISGLCWGHCFLSDTYFISTILGKPGYPQISNGSTTNLLQSHKRWLLYFDHQVHHFSEIYCKHAYVIIYVKTLKNICCTAGWKSKTGRRCKFRFL